MNQRRCEIEMLCMWREMNCVRRNVLCEEGHLGHIIEWVITNSEVPGSVIIFTNFQAILFFRVHYFEEAATGVYFSSIESILGSFSICWRMELNQELNTSCMEDNNSDRFVLFHDCDHNFHGDWVERVVDGCKKNFFTFVLNKS